jgi:hypothetical protein
LVVGLLPLRRAPVGKYAFPTSGFGIEVELEPTHPYFAEYKHFAYLTKAGQRIASAELFPDTGGYARLNLYWVNERIWTLRGFHDIQTIDLAKATITAGGPHAGDDRLMFVGAFDLTENGSSVAWNFVPARDRSEMPVDAHSVGAP